MAGARAREELYLKETLKVFVFLITILLVRYLLCWRGVVNHNIFWLSKLISVKEIIV
uniref:Uncharacterized protein n=1 Tax=Phlebia radiata TaxID=5308 RepID=L8B9I1_PHLRA|nr:hypothetical protein Pra_mt0323 [Phlebia radiata]CCF07391.1 hypothetical protein Pra_mt0323 [Phlebia radiata]